MTVSPVMVAAIAKPASTAETRRAFLLRALFMDIAFLPLQGSRLVPARGGVRGPAEGPDAGRSVRAAAEISLAAGGVAYQAEQRRTSGGNADRGADGGATSRRVRGP
ncbi:hypothetical protein GCM10009830_29630 [Glycomyces endophyticus]|uniref:Uncharacterized protein n=1 Tax=Glycomyces endophyticus TaxID=480996 RepID=A0ABN2H213_9ACTN